MMPRPMLGHLGGPPPVATTLYIGKISPLVDDDLLKAVLTFCGAVKRRGPPVGGQAPWPAHREHAAAAAAAAGSG